MTENIVTSLESQYLSFYADHHSFKFAWCILTALDLQWRYFRNSYSP